MANRYRYFSPADAVRSGRLSLVARQVVEGVITGLHRSPHRGFSVEFSEHREYVPGDELRHMDWKQLARSDRYYIKLYEQETNLRAVLAVDNSASMRFGQKHEYARHMAACLAYVLAHQQDQVGLACFDERITAELPPASSPAHLDRLFLELERQQPADRAPTAVAAAVHELAERLPRRSLLIVLSDLWDELSELGRALQHLRYRKHQGLLLHILDPVELELNYDQQLTLEDLESGERLAIDPRDLREAYIEKVGEHLARLRRACGDCGVEYHQIRTDQPYHKALVELINRRSR